MPISRSRLAIFLLAAALAAGPVLPAAANDNPHRVACLTKAEQRAAVANHQAIPLAEAIKSLHRKKRGEVVRARLCRHGDGLVYVLTVLARSGKVTRATIDAVTGEHIKEHKAGIGD